jgi:hypothetical protein
MSLLRSQSKVDLMRDNFEKCCNAIKSTIDFVVRECGCQSSKVIGGDTTLIPLVYYLFHQKKHQVPNKEFEFVRKSFFLLGLTRPFSRYADSRLGAFFRNVMKPRFEDADTSFPFDQLVSRISHWERVWNFGPDLLQGNPTLALHILQRHTGAQVHYEDNSPQMDHIFPRSELRERDVEHHNIEHFANLWILAKGKNLNKSDKHPADYFRDVSDAEMKRALIDRKMLNYGRYNTFLKSRTEAMLKAISKETGLSQSDFDLDES